MCGFGFLISGGPGPLPQDSQGHLFNYVGSRSLLCAQRDADFPEAWYPTVSVHHGWQLQPSVGVVGVFGRSSGDQRSRVDLR